MAAQFLIFLEKWSEIFPEYRDDDVFFLKSDILTIALYYRRIVCRSTHSVYCQRNYQTQCRTWKRTFLNLSDLLEHFKLKGLLIGNGWIDPVSQYPAYSTYAYDAGLIKHGTDEGKAVDAEFAKCKKMLDRGSHVSLDQCENVLDTILRVTRDKYFHSRRR